MRKTAALWICIKLLHYGGLAKCYKFETYQIVIKPQDLVLTNGFLYNIFYIHCRNAFGFLIGKMIFAALFRRIGPARGNGERKLSISPNSFVTLGSR